MNAFKLITRIPENRKISLDVPSDIPVGPVEIIFVYQPRLKTSSEDIIERTCGSLLGSRFNTERYLQFKKEDKEIER